MKNLIAAMLLLLVAAPSRASGPLAGHLDLKTMPAFGAWQSLQSPDQAFGVSKRLFHLDYSAQTILNVGIFGGVSKPLLSEPAATPVALGGLTMAMPGSTLDWALGTSWGDLWAPRLKTGILCAYDLSRPNALKVVPGFVGFGVTYR